MQFLSKEGYGHTPIKNQKRPKAKNVCFFSYIAYMAMEISKISERKGKNESGEKKPSASFQSYSTLMLNGHININK